MKRTSPYELGKRARARLCEKARRTGVPCTACGRPCEECARVLPIPADPRDWIPAPLDQRGPPPCSGA